MERLDKFLSAAGVASRKELKGLIRAGKVIVDGTVIRAPDTKINETARVTVSGAEVEPYRTAVVMLHKPQGYVTAAEDPKEQTVMELLPRKYRLWNVMPIGRLDKQTEGLLLFTNDGELAHRLISPKQEVEKVYYARHEGIAAATDVQAFSDGITLQDGTVCRPARLEILAPGECLVTVTEGKYHQVRRMLASRSLPVSYLKRLKEGGLSLGELPLGDCRELTQAEIDTLL